MCVGKPHIQAYYFFLLDSFFFLLRHKRNVTRTTNGANIGTRCAKNENKEKCKKKQNNASDSYKRHRKKAHTKDRERDGKINEEKYICVLKKKSTRMNSKQAKEEPDELFRSVRSTKRIDNRTINILAINIVAIKCHNILYAFEYCTHMCLVLFFFFCSLPFDMHIPIRI